MKIKYTYKIALPTLMFLFLLSWVACKKYENPAPFYEEEKDGQTITTDANRKILMICIDGAVGKEIEKIMPSTIKEILPHSKFTWTGLSESNTGDATTWSTLVTGVGLNKHLILDDSFVPKTNLESGQSVIPFYPTLFYRILNTRPKLKTLTITPWSKLNEALFLHANKRITVSSDLEVKDSAIYELQNGNSSVVLLNFMDVLAAGKQSGFSADVPEYATAINTVDGYIGEVLEALKGRKTYNQEDWMVILTSNHGGTGKSYGGSSDPERNTFSMFYHPKYTSLNLEGVKLTNAAVGPTVKASIPDPSGDYNNERLGTFTFEARIKINPNSNGTYEYGNFVKVLGKSKWGIFRQRDQMKVYISEDQGLAYENGAVSFNDGKWHSLAVVTTTEARKWRVKMYIDGALTFNTEAPREANTTTDNEPFVIGGTDVNYNIEEVRIWNKELNAAQIAENACLNEITTSHLAFNNLIGYWRGNDASAGNIWKSAITGKPDFQITGPIQYTTSANSLPCNNGGNSVVLENFSIVPQIYYWLQIPVESSWSLDGSVILSRFEPEFQ